jgi:DinB family protein
VPAPLLSADEIMAILPVTPSRIAELADGLTEAQLNAEPEPGEWPATILLAHLRAAQDVLGANIVRILREDRPAWKRLSPRERQRKSGYNERAFAAALDAFATGRAELLPVLEPLRPEDWERVAAVTVAPDRVLEQTARFFGDWLAGHELVHLDQFERTVRAVSR